jgi:osmotically-inducible protein OsmY
MSYIVAGFAFVFIIGGCTQASKNEYSDAGSHIEAAAKETGAALKADADHAKNAAQDAIARNDLSSKIRKGIQDHPDLGVTDLSVDITGNQVKLKGNVPNEKLNQRTAHLAKSLAGPGYTVEDLLSVGAGKS